MSSGQFLTHGGADRTLAGRRGERQPLVQRSADLTVSVDIFHGRIDRTGLFCALEEPTLHRREVGCPAGVGRVQTAIDDRSPSQNERVESESDASPRTASTPAM